MSTTYIAEPSLLAFHQDRYTQQVRIIRGVPGGGKTVACILELLYCAMEQPANAQGVRKTRFLVARQTYSRLLTTTLKSFKEWMPEPIWIVRQTVPITAWGRFALADNTRVECEVVFMSFDDDKSLEALKSLELTGVYVNEIPEMSEEILKKSLERTTRYPRKSDGGGHFGFMVWADANSPHTGHWLETLENDPFDKWKFYLQPQPLIPQYAADKRTIVGWVPNPHAENIKNLPGGIGYYLDRVNAMDKREIDQGILNRYGQIFAGRAVFGEFWDQDIHILPQVTVPDPIAQVYVGMDTSGLNPAAVFIQMIQGSAVVLRELVSQDTPFSVFVDDYLGPMVAEHFPRNQLLFLTDPSNPRDAGLGLTATQRLIKAGYTAQTARTNSWLPRREAVNHFLKKRRGLYVDKSCVTLVAAMGGRYAYKELTKDVYKEIPDKNRWSDVADALQYGLMHLQAAAGGTQQERVPWGKKKQTHSLV